MSPSLALRSLCVFAALAPLAPLLKSAESAELIDARTRLLAAFKDGQTDYDENVKKLRAKIAALEYVASATSGGSNLPPLVSVDFPGGPASVLVAAITKTNGNNGFNVVGEKADMAIELPAFSIRNADPAALAGAINGLLLSRGYTLTAGYRVSPGQSAVYTLRKVFPYEASTDPRMMPQFQSFQLANYLERQSVDDIVGAIRAAWELDPALKPDSLRIKFHPATGVLLVSGPQQAIYVAQNILMQLRQGPEATVKTGPDPKASTPPGTEKK